MHTPPAARDGRDARWDAHRQQRREQLLEMALSAIRAHGPDVGMEEIAGAAATSKAVLYRHLGDKQGLHRRVTELVSDRIRLEVARAVEQETTARQAVSAVVEHYLVLVEKDPQVYRFVISGPRYSPGADPLRSLATQVGAELTGLLAAAGIERATAEVWGPALMGLVRAAADDWMARDPRPARCEVVASLTQLAWNGLRSAARPEYSGRAAPAAEEGSHSGLVRRS